MSQTTTGRKLCRPTGHRKSLLRNLAVELLRHESIRTTKPKAKEVSSFVEHLISVAKSNDLVARKRVAQDIHDSQVMQKLFGVLKTRYQSRIGGYTRVFSLGNRAGDNAPISLVKLVS